MSHFSLKVVLTLGSTLEDDVLKEVQESIDSFMENLENKNRELLARGKGEELVKAILKMKDDKKKENTALLKKLYEKDFKLNASDLPKYLTEAPAVFYELLDEQKPKEQKLQVDPNDTGQLIFE